MGNMQQLLSSLPVFFIIIIISIVFYSLPPVSARSQSSPGLRFDRETYRNFFVESVPPSFDLTFVKSENSARLESWNIGLTDLETHQNSAQAESTPSFRSAPETNQKHLNYDYDFQNSRLIPNVVTNSAYLKENKKASKLVSSKDLNSTVSKVSARSQSSPQFLSFDRETYLAASLPRSSLFDLTFEKFDNSARSQSYPPSSLFDLTFDRETYGNLAASLPRSSLFDRTLEKFKNSTRLQSSAWTSLLADLETHQNSAQAESSPSFRPAPETNQKYLNCDCYQMSAQPRSSSSFSASLETLQKQLNYEFQNIVLLRQAMTHSSYSLENNKEFSILGERLIETTVSLRLSTEDLEISLKDLNDKMSEVLKVDTSCAADGTRLGLQNIVRVSSSTDSSTSSIVCDAFRAIIWAIALDSGKCDDAHNVFWAVHGGDGKAI